MCEDSAQSLRVSIIIIVIIIIKVLVVIVGCESSNEPQEHTFQDQA